MAAGRSIFVGWDSFFLGYYASVMPTTSVLGACGCVGVGVRGGTLITKTATREGRDPRWFTGSIQLDWRCYGRVVGGDGGHRVSGVGGVPF